MNAIDVEFAEACKVLNDHLIQMTTYLDVALKRCQTKGTCNAIMSYIDRHMPELNTQNSHLQTIRGNVGRADNISQVLAQLETVHANFDLMREQLRRFHVLVMQTA